MTFSEHDELAIELEAQNTHKLELKLFPATLDLYASSKGTVISTLNGEIRSFQNLTLSLFLILRRSFPEQL